MTQQLAAPHANPSSSSNGSAVTVDKANGKRISTSSSGSPATVAGDRRPDEPIDSTSIDAALARFSGWNTEPAKATDLDYKAWNRHAHGANNDILVVAIRRGQQLAYQAKVNKTDKTRHVPLTKMAKKLGICPRYARYCSSLWKAVEANGGRIPEAWSGLAIRKILRLLKKSPAKTKSKQLTFSSWESKLNALLALMDELPAEKWETARRSGEDAFRNAKRSSEAPGTSTTSESPRKKCANSKRDPLDAYYTPPEVAAAIPTLLGPTLAALPKGSRVLEPHSGGGALVKVLAQHMDVVALDLDAAAKEPSLRAGAVSFECVNFLEWETTERFPVVVGNPPFTDWHRHLVKALSLTTDDGSVAFLLPLTITGTDEYHSLFESAQRVIEIPLAPTKRFYKGGTTRVNPGALGLFVWPKRDAVNHTTPIQDWRR